MIEPRVTIRLFSSNTGSPERPMQIQSAWSQWSSLRSSTIYSTPIVVEHAKLNVNTDPSNRVETRWRPQFRLAGLDDTTHTIDLEPGGPPLGAIGFLFPPWMQPPGSVSQNTTSTILDLTVLVRAFKFQILLLRGCRVDCLPHNRWHRGHLH